MNDVPYSCNLQKKKHFSTHLKKNAISLKFEKICHKYTLTALY